MGPRGAEYWSGLSLRTDQHTGLHADSQRTDQLRHRLFNLARNIGGSSGIATVTTLQPRRARYHQSVLHLTPYDAAYRDTVAQVAGVFVSNGAGSADAGNRAAGVVYGTLLKQSSMLAFADAFWVMAVLFLAIIPLMFLLKKTGPARGAIQVE